MNNKTLSTACSFILAVVTSAMLISCGAPDISVQSIEVTQEIQTTTNTVPLFAQRATAVRVTVGTGGTTVNNVTGKLTVLVNGTAITPPGGISSLAPINAVAAPDRNVEDQLLAFELPAPSGITASNDVDFTVVLDAASGETNTANNTGAANNLTFSNRSTPNLFFTRINYTPSGLGLPNLADVQPGRGDLFVRGIYPVNDADANLYRQGLFPTLTYTEDADGDGRLNAFGSDGDNLLALLASCRQLIVNNGLGAADNTFLYGWLAGNPIDGNGLGQIAGFNAFGNTESIRFQRTYAHELGHNFGLDHNDITGNPEDLDGQTGWDVGPRLPSQPAANNVSGRVKPSTFFDIMTGGKLSAEAWLHTTTFNVLLNNAAVGGAPGPDESKPRRRIAVIQGIFNNTGDSLLYLLPVFRYPWLSLQQRMRQQDNLYIARVVDNNGTVSEVPFNARVGDDSGKPKFIDYGFFEVMVPISETAEIATVQIVDIKNPQRVFGEFKRSSPPRISILSPRPGSKLDKRTVVKWDAKDSDTPLGDLLFQAAYSPNGGTSWVPIGVNLKGTSFIFNSDEIQKSDGTGIIRVYVSDGLNTSYADVIRLSTSAALY